MTEVWVIVDEDDDIVVSGAVVAVVRVVGVGAV
jgi:hypothetical protein